MTPKEKAKELVYKFWDLGLGFYEQKKCALIAIDEMINEYPSQCPKDSYEYERHLYWIEVKKEIEKL